VREDRVRGVGLASLLIVTAALAACYRTSLVGSPHDGLVDGSQTASSEGGTAPADGSPGVGPSAGWAISAGGSGDDECWNLLVDNAGDLVIAGHLGGTATFGAHTVTPPGGAGYFVAKLEPKKGVFRWVTPLAGPPTSSWTGLDLDAAGNIFFAGAFTGEATYGSTRLTSQGDEDGFVAKLAPDGAPLWASALATGPGRDSVNGVAVGMGGKLTITGSFTDTASIAGAGLTAHDGTEIFVARLNADRSLDWVAQSGSDDWGGVRETVRLIVETSGYSYVAGTVGPNAAFGKFALAGAAGQPTAFVAQLDPFGTFVRATPLARSVADGPLGIDISGDIFVGIHSSVPWVGSEQGQSKIWKLDLSHVLWNLSPAGDGAISVRGLLLDSGSGGGLTMGGFLQGAALMGAVVLHAETTGGDGFLAHVDAYGNAIDPKLIGTGASSRVLALARDGGGNLYVAGHYSGGALTIGTTMLPGRGGWDVYVWNRGPEQR
jgi:hypothetical protein